jgi:hypothetical protein
LWLFFAGTFGDQPAPPCGSRNCCSEKYPVKRGIEKGAIFMAIYEFEEAEIGEQVFEITTSDCRFCPLRQRKSCLNFVKQGSPQCIQMVTEHLVAKKYE